MQNDLHLYSLQQEANVLKFEVIQEANVLTCEVIQALHRLGENVSQPLLKWEHVLQDTKRKRRSKDKIDYKRRNDILSSAFSTIKEKATEHKRMRTTELKVILRWKCLGLSKDLCGWIVKELLHNQAKVQVVLRWKFLHVSKGVCWWNEHTVDQRRLDRADMEIVLRRSRLATRLVMSRWRRCLSVRKELAGCETKVECRMQKMRLWSAFTKLEQLKWLSQKQYFDDRIGDCVIRWVKVEASKASVAMRLMRRAFITWHTQRWQEPMIKQEEKMSNNALRRCHNKAIRHEWKCWNGQHLKLVRLKDT